MSEVYIPSQSDEIEKPQHNYKILTRDYYDERITHQQGVEMPAIFTSDEKMRTVYIERTDKLIERIREDNVDCVIYLDKSARPVAWMVNELWPILAPDTPKPDNKFINVDAHHWLYESEARPESHEVAAMTIPQSVINELHSIFGDEFYKKDSNGQVMVDDNGQKIGKNVLIVDEIAVTGSSLALAKKMLSEAFPGVKFDTTPWLQATTVERSGRLVPAELTVWYHETDVHGRGVGDIKPGSQILSAPLTGHDQLSTDLRADIKQLGQDVRNGKQAIRPWQDDDSIYYETGESGQPDYKKPKYKIDSAESI